MNLITFNLKFTIFLFRYNNIFFLIQKITLLSLIIIDKINIIRKKIWNNPIVIENLNNE